MASVSVNSYSESEKLLLAAQTGSIQRVKAALKAGADIEFELHKSETIGTGTALYIALRDGHLDIMRLLLRKGASFMKRLPGGYTLLHLAAHKGKTEAAELLVQHGATLDVLDSCQNTPLMAAAYSNNIDTVRRLIELGARPDLTDGGMAQRLGIDGSTKKHVYTRPMSTCIRLIHEARRSKLLRCCNPKCGKPGYRKKLKLCAGCKLTRYCSRDCQKQHWSVGHKKCCGHDACPAVGLEAISLPCP
ncbi:ankyrin-3-like [Branchiostoma floridae]|uniref:Ankyrin-3-like n=1 Tax=Branchiostoma floridae TaxID=7739 RepID=A0A9J7LFY4_BRAFL|nr:ankyrin-3-like [Branchiostoma floridae]